MLHIQIGGRECLFYVNKKEEDPKPLEYFIPWYLLSICPACLIFIKTLGK